MGELRLYTIAEAAGVLKTSEMFVRKLIKDKSIAAAKIGGSWKIREEELRAYVDGVLPFKQKKSAEEEAAREMEAAPPLECDTAKKVEQLLVLEKMPVNIAGRFALTDSLLSKALSETSSWKKEGKAVSFVVSSPLYFKLLLANQSDIQKAASELLGEDVELKIILEQRGASHPQKEAAKPASETKHGGAMPAAPAQKKKGEAKPDIAVLRRYLDLGSSLYAQRYWEEKNMYFPVRWNGGKVTRRTKASKMEDAVIASAEDLQAAIENGVEVFAFLPSKAQLVCFLQKKEFAEPEFCKAASVYMYLPSGQKIAYFSCADRGAMFFARNGGKSLTEVFGGGNRRTLICAGSVLNGDLLELHGDLAALLNKER